MGSISAMHDACWRWRRKPRSTSNPRQPDPFCHAPPHRPDPLRYRVPAWAPPGGHNPTLQLLEILDLVANGSTDCATTRRASGAIHVLLYSDAREVGGAELSAARLVACVPDSVQVRVAAIDSVVLATLRGGRPGMDGYLLPSASKRELGAVAAHLAFFRRRAGELDVVHLNLRTPWSCQYALLGATVAGIPVVTTAHAVVRASGWLQGHPARRLFGHVRCCVAVSHWTAGEVASMWGVPESVVRVIPNGIDPGTIASGRARPIDGRRSPIVGCVGRLSPEKGFDIALRALLDLPGVRLEVVGDGLERPALESLATSLGVADRVEFLGWMADPTARMASWDVLAVPSRLESFGVVAVEAMLVGVPVVATVAGGLPEVITDGETGVLVQVESPAALAAGIRRVLDDGAYSRRLVLSAAEAARRDFTSAAMADRYAEVYSQVSSPPA